MRELSMANFPEADRNAMIWYVFFSLSHYRLVRSTDRQNPLTRTALHIIAAGSAPVLLLELIMVFGNYLLAFWGR
jgi:hypothetical protein